MAIPNFNKFPNFYRLIDGSYLNAIFTGNVAVNLAVTSGSLNSTPIGATTPSTGAFTTVSSTGLSTLNSVKVDTGTKTAAATAGAATLNKNAGVITSESLTTAAGATYTLTLTDSTIAAADQVMASVQLGSATTGTPTIATVTPAAGSVVIVVQNIHASAALNGTIKISYVTFKN
jgi:hypothetical protein